MLKKLLLPLLITVAGGFIVYVLTQLPVLNLYTENIVYQIHKPVSININNRSISVVQIDLANLGWQSATNVEITFNFHDKTDIIGKSITYPNINAVNHQYQMVSTSEKLVKIPSIISNEVISVTLITDRLLDKLPKVMIRSLKTVGKEAEVRVGGVLGTGDVQLFIFILSVAALSAVLTYYLLPFIRRYFPHKVYEEYSLVTSFPQNLFASIEKASDIWMFGVNQGDTINLYYSTILKAIANGASLKVVLANPNGSVPAMTAIRFPGNVGPEHEKVRITESLQRLCKIKKIGGERVEIKIVDYLFSYGGFIIKGKNSSGTAYIKRYTIKTSGGSRKPKFFYKSGKGPWFDLYVEEFNNIWEAAEYWECSR